jgi:hypothetical protein
MRRLALGTLAVGVVLLLANGEAEAFCRRSTPAWTDSTPIRVVVQANMQDYMRHPFVNSSGVVDANQFCTTNANCGTDGFCATGFPTGLVNRCRGPRWTRSELIRSVQWMISRINNESGADIPFVFLDTNDSPSEAECPIEDNCSDSARPWMNCFQFDTIVITSSECDQTSMTSATWTGAQWLDTNDSGLRNKLIRFWSSNDAGGEAWRGVTWTHYQGMFAGNFEATLLHEMGHALGLAHVMNDYPGGYPVCVPTIPSGSTGGNSVCPAGTAGTCAIMNSDSGIGAGLNSHYYGFDDVQGLVALYGLESSPDTRLFEDDSLASSSFFELSTTDLALITDVRASAVASISHSSVSVAGRRRNANFMQEFQVFDWSWAALTSTSVAVVSTPGFSSIGPIGLSNSTTQRVLSSHPLRLTGDARRYRRRLHDTVIPVSGGSTTTTTTNPSIGAADDTAVGGVSTAYDPISGATIHAIRRDDGQVLLRGLRGSTWSNVVVTPFRSWAPPSIACSPTTCFMVLVEMPFPVTASTQTRLQWAEFSFNWPTGGSASIPAGTTLYTVWNNITADPVASVVYNASGGWDFFVTVSLPALIGSTFGSRIFTYRHTAGSTTLSLLLPQVVDLPGVAAQATSAGTGAYAEVFTFSSF